MPELEGLSDRQVADTLRCDIRWKVAAGLPLDHAGVHFTMFTYWRTRMVRSSRPERIRKAVSEVIVATGVLTRRQRRALDSTLSTTRWPPRHRDPARLGHPPGPPDRPGSRRGHGVRS